MVIFRYNRVVGEDMAVRTVVSPVYFQKSKKNTIDDH
jgi:hypothetical protein